MLAGLADSVLEHIAKCQRCERHDHCTEGLRIMHDVGNRYAALLAPIPDGKEQKD